MNLKKAVKEWFKDFKEGFKNKTAALIAFIFAGFMFWLLIQLLMIFYEFSLIEWIKDIPFLEEVFLYLFREITSQTPLGVFYLFMIASLFFLPIPLEALYFNFLRNGFPFPSLMFYTVGGIVVGQMINYWLGRLFGFIFMSFIKKKTRRSVKTKLTKYGIFAIVLVHLIPFPFQVFNLLAGAFRYKFWKWIVFVILGLVIKHLIMYWIFLI